MEVLSMPKRSESTAKLSTTPPPALTDEGREKRLVSMAYDLIEKRLLDGSASATETTAIIKLGTEREKLEREKLQAEVNFTRSKSEALAQAQRMEELMTEAINAFKRYSGETDEEDLY
jgi:hypothetical protein